MFMVEKSAACRVVCVLRLRVFRVCSALTLLAFRWGLFWISKEFDVSTVEGRMLPRGQDLHETADDSNYIENKFAKRSLLWSHVQQLLQPPMSIVLFQ